MNQQEPWPKSWTKEIGGAVRRRRDTLGISAAGLSELCEKVGFPIPRSTITNLENGRKESLPLHELVVLARALDTSPVELLAPVGDVDSLEILPNDSRPPLEVVEWFSANLEWNELGHLKNLGKRAAAESDMGETDDRMLTYWRMHQRLVEAFYADMENYRRFTQNAEKCAEGKPATFDLFGPANFGEDDWNRLKDSALAHAQDEARQVYILRKNLQSRGAPTPPLYGDSGIDLAEEWIKQGLGLPDNRTIEPLGHS